MPIEYNVKVVTTSERVLFYTNWALSSGSSSSAEELRQSLVDFFKERGETGVTVVAAIETAEIAEAWLAVATAESDQKRIRQGVLEFLKQERARRAQGEFIFTTN